MVEQIHVDCARTLDGLRAAMTNDNLAAEPDAFAQIKDLADDNYAVLDKDMDDLVRATSATLRTCDGDPGVDGSDRDRSSSFGRDRPETLPLGSVGYENAVDGEGQRLIWLDRSVVDRLRSLRGPGESMSDVILRLAAEAGADACASIAFIKRRNERFRQPGAQCDRSCGDSSPEVDRQISSRGPIRQGPDEDARRRHGCANQASALCRIWKIPGIDGPIWVRVRSEGDDLRTHQGLRQPYLTTVETS